MTDRAVIGYTMVGTRDLPRALDFYSGLFAEMGWEVAWQDDSGCSFGNKRQPGVPTFVVCRPFDGQPASVGNGTMTAFRFTSTATVDRLYALALNSGGSSEGEPGYRPQYGKGFYAGYVRDPDGNKLAFVVYR